MRRVTDHTGKFFKGLFVNKQTAYRVYSRLQQLEDNLEDAEKVWKDRKTTLANETEYMRGFYNGADAIMAAIEGRNSNPIMQSDESPILPRLKISQEEFGVLVSACTTGLDAIIQAGSRYELPDNKGVLFHPDVERMQQIIQGIINRLEVES